ncbi:MAG TPA: transposase, partial [Ktedonobacteraceae bacterium]|nr:transposase [Ktedonobacteraceae bacterium]
MNESITSTTNHFSPAASLAALGVKLSQLDLFGPIRTQVQIKQKTVKHTPTDKLYDAFISLLAGAHGLVEINTRLRTDLALQHAFGRQGCAEQSVVQQTLDACTTENVRQLEQAMDAIYRQHSRGYRHDYQAGLQLLDVDMSGLPCGPKAAFATKGYFAGQYHRRGRQLGRVLA